MHSNWITGAALIAGLVGPGLASAEPLELKFRLVVKTYGMEVTELASLPGHTIGSGPAAGVAVFDDGRIAYKDFVITTNGTADTGDYQGYSTYTFENGDSITAKFTGGWSAEGETALRALGARDRARACAGGHPPRHRHHRRHGRARHRLSIRRRIAEAFCGAPAEPLRDAWRYRARLPRRRPRAAVRFPARPSSGASAKLARFGARRGVWNGDTAWPEVGYRHRPRRTASGSPSPAAWSKAGAAVMMADQGLRDKLLRAKSRPSAARA